MTTNDNNNVISSARNDKLVVNDAPKVQKSKVSIKRVSSGGRKWGSTVTKVTKPKQNNTVVPDGLKKHCNEMSTDDNHNVISAACKDKLVVNAAPKGQKSKVSTKRVLSGGCKSGSTVTKVAQ